MKTELDNQQERLRLAAKLKPQETQAADLKEKLAHREHETSDLAMKLKADKAQAAELKTTRAHQKQETKLLAKLTAQIQQLKLNRANRDKRIKSLKAQLAAICASRSWRITAPLRYLVGTLLARLQEKLRSSVEGSAHSAKAPGTSSSNMQRPSATHSASQRVAYQDLLIRSLFNPKITPPYTEQDKYFCTFMASYRSYLQRLYKNNPEKNLISIIMPTFNQEHFIRNAIQSVLCQTYRNWELVIIDDRSTDNTAAVTLAVADSRIKYIRLDTNQGPAGARNAGLEKASGEFVTYLDSHNTLDRDFLLILANELQESSLFDSVYCAQRAFYEKNGRMEEAFVRFAPFHRPSLENENYIDLGVLMHRRSLLDRCGTFNAGMRKHEDWEFILRCTIDNCPKPVPVILSNYYFAKTNDQITSVESKAAIQKLDACIRTDFVTKSVTDVPIAGVERLYSLPYTVSKPCARKPVSIVIPSFEAESYLRACVEAIYAFSQDHAFELIVVDNRSSASIVNYLNELANRKRTKVLLNDSNLGFTFAVNQGIEVADQRNDVIIINNDAIVTRGWLDGFQTVLFEYPDVGLIMPSQILLPTEKSSKAHQPYRNPQRECDANISAHHGNVLDPLFNMHRGYFELAFAPFFCVYVPRSTLQSVGLLDVESAPHYYSDNIYCDLVRAHGKRIIYTPHCKIYHFVQRATFDLKRGDPDLFRKMFISNDWNAIATHLRAPS